MRLNGFLLCFTALLCARLPTVLSASWCGKEGCYQILGVKESADPKHIRNVYYRLSRQYHPDKSKDPDAPIKFQRIAKAYEILSDSRSRKRYDYALAHPEEDIREEPYGIWKYWKTDARAVLLGFVLVVSAIQYYAKKSSHDAAWRKIRETPRYKNRRAQFLADWDAQQSAAAGNGGMVNGSTGPKAAPAKLARRSTKAKSKRPNMSPEDEQRIQDLVDSEVGLHGSGYNMPTYRDTLAYHIVMSPVWLSQWLYWQAHWQWSYVLLKQEYNEDDKAYQTRQRLKYSMPVWEGLPAEQRRELIDMELWKAESWKQFLRDDRPGSMRRRLPKLVKLEAEPQFDAWAAVDGE